MELRTAACVASSWKIAFMHNRFTRLVAASGFVGLFACSRTPVYEGRSVKQWIEAVRRGDATERSHAADVVARLPRALARI